MRSMRDMDTIQIEITDACTNICSNCTRFCGHKKVFFMSFEQFQAAVDSMVGYPKMTGIMGGEPLLHPEFEKFCKYISTKIPKTQLGLWTTLPKGYEKYREIICETFEHIFINDHSRDDIFHHPTLVAIEEVVTDKNEMWQLIDHCWAQESWSASINPKGAWFCEIAAAMAMLYDEGKGWDVEQGWWNRIPKDFKEQMEQFCPKCGLCIPLHRRKSTEQIDDISPKHYERLKDTSPKIKKGLYKIHDLKMITPLEQEQMAKYKEFDYRDAIASRYGIFLTVNNQKFWTPHLKENWKLGDEIKYASNSILKQYQERFK